MIISDSFHQSMFIHVFNKKNGEHLKSFGGKGLGPGELTHPISIGIDKKNNRLIVYSHNQKKMIHYDIASLLNETINYEEQKVTMNGPYVSDMRFANEKIFVRGITEDMRFGLKDGSSINVLWDNYPKILNDKNNSEEDRAVLNYASMWKVSPDGKKMVHATYIGGIIEFFSIDDTNHVQSERINHYYYPSYKLVDGATPLAVSWHQETTLGFQGLFVSDSTVYALVNGGKASDMSFFPKDIAVFNWKGKGDIKYTLDISISVFAVDEKETKIYAVTFPNEEWDEDIKLVCFDY